jgi:hypothetical protein
MSHEDWLRNCIKQIAPNLSEKEIEDYVKGFQKIYPIIKPYNEAIMKIHDEKEQLALLLQKDPKNQKFKIEIDLLTWILTLFP